MIITDTRYVLPVDVDQVILPAQDEVLLTRRGSRIPPQLVSADAMALLEQFREPATVTEAVLRYCATTGADPLTTLDEAFAVLIALTRSDVLVVDGSDAADTLDARHHVGEHVGPATITARVRVLRDSEIWRGVLDDRTAVIIKIIDQPVVGPDQVRREIAALDRLGGTTVPRLIWHEASTTGGSIVITEVNGDPADLAVLTLTDDHPRRRLALAVLDAYVDLHRRGVLHGDVHPGNILVRDASTELAGVSVIDFGLAQVLGTAPPPRASGGEQLDPQAAAAALAEQPLPPLDAAAEQYSLAAVLFRLLTGSTYLDLERERSAALTLITTEAPRRFVTVAVDPWPAGEQVLRRALAKQPGQRFDSVQSFRDAFAGAIDLAQRAGPGIGRKTDDAADPPARLADGAADLDADLATAVAELEVTGSVWASADSTRAEHVAWFLRRVALLAADVTAHDLAGLWSHRCGGVEPPVSDPSLPVAAAHRALADYARTGRGRSLRVAQGIASRLRGSWADASTQPLTDATVDVHTGPWAGLLLALECRRPALARSPGGAVVGSGR